MISSQDLLNSITLKIRGWLNTRDDINAEVIANKSDLQAFLGNNDCIYVERHQISNEVGTEYTNINNNIIDIFFYGKHSLSDDFLNVLSDEFTKLFFRNIRVGNEIIDISSVEHQIHVDAIGKYLHTSLYLKYFDYYQYEEEIEVMQDFSIAKSESVITEKKSDDTKENNKETNIEVEV